MLFVHSCQIRLKSLPDIGVGMKFRNYIILFIFVPGLIMLPFIAPNLVASHQSLPINLYVDTILLSHKFWMWLELFFLLADSSIHDLRLASMIVQYVSALGSGAGASFCCVTVEIELFSYTFILQIQASNILSRWMYCSYGLTFLISSAHHKGFLRRVESPLEACPLRYTWNSWLRENLVINLSIQSNNLLNGATDIFT